MWMLRLAPEIQEYVLAMPETIRRSAISERALRPIAQLPRESQLHAFEEFLSRRDAG
jgi:hypothetical protein